MMSEFSKPGGVEQSQPFEQPKPRDAVGAFLSRIKAKYARGGNSLHEATATPAQEVASQTALEQTAVHTEPAMMMENEPGDKDDGSQISPNFAELLQRLTSRRQHTENRPQAPEAPVLKAERPRSLGLRSLQEVLKRLPNNRVAEATLRMMPA